MNKVVKGNVNVFDIAGNIEEGFNMDFLKDIKIGITREQYCEYQLLKEENEQLKKMVNFGGITIVNCPECNKEINVNFCRETEEYRKKYQELKDRMEKARIFVQQNIRDIDYDCEEYDYLMELLGNEVNE